MQTPPDKTIVLPFRSIPTKRPESGWFVEVTFPPGSTRGSVLPVKAEDGSGAPIDYGRFEIAGKVLVIRDGKSSMTYDDFIRGKHERGLWMHRRGLPPIPGGLTFG